MVAHSACPATRGPAEASLQHCLKRGEGPSPRGSPVRGHFLGPEATATEHKDQRLACSAEAGVGAAAARAQAGCMLWDMSADEGHASVMCTAGLAAVSCKVLADCADATAQAVAKVGGETAAASSICSSSEREESTEKRARAAGEEESPAFVVKGARCRPLAAAEGDDGGRIDPVREEDGAKGKNEDVGEDTHKIASAEPKDMTHAAASGVTAEVLYTVEAAGGPLAPPPEPQGVDRLREIACGLLANVCSHRSLR